MLKKRAKFLSPLTMELERRSQVFYLLKSGIKDPKKIHKLTKIPLSTVYSIKNRIESGKGVQREAGSGAREKLSASDKKRISNLANSNPKFSCARIATIAHSRGSPQVHSTTIWRHLKNAGYLKLVPKKIPMLTARHRKNRVDWCKKHLETDWSKVVISDESMFQMFRHKVPMWGKKRRNIKAPSRSPQVMVWGGISSRGATPLIFVKGSIDAKNYIKILEEGLISTMNFLYPEGFIFQQDNAPSHRAKITKKWLKDNGLVIMEWPAMSPDLSPIEHLWSIIKNELETMKPMKMEQWLEKINGIWQGFGPEYLAKFFDSMKERLQKCISSEGRTIKL
jgi:transposase